ncbi:MAG: SH3 domain-containing protein [Lachnospiraceae bacterium]|nr:SH3 domain-containing protein [Lachnospiraceae bacterium]
MLRKQLNIFKGILLAILVVIISLSIKNVSARAEEEGESWVHYEGTVTVSSALNVRTGAGTGFDQLKDETGNIIQLKPQEEVIILEDVVSDDGKVWFKVQFDREGKTYEGFATSTYIAKKEDKQITPTPLPTPTATPTPSPTPIEEIATATKAVSPSPSLSDSDKDSDSKEGGNSKSAILFVIFAVIAVAVVFFGLFVILGLVKQNKRKNRIRNARKVDKIRSNDQENQSGKRRPEIRRSDDDGAYVREVRQSVYYTNSEDEDEIYGIKSETDDKRSLRAAVDRLQQHDIINHKVYGEGEVYDNSDVKLMEVRFGNDVRFLNKDSIVAKKLIEIIDDEDQATARRRNKRNRNKRNDY